MNYNVYLWLLVKWAKETVQLRREDILIRREVHEQNKQDIEAKQEHNRILNETYQEKLQEALAAHAEMLAEEEEAAK